MTGNQLLSFTRRGPAPAEFQSLDLRTTITRCLDAVEERVHRHEIQVVTECDDDLPQINGDPDRLMQLARGAAQVVSVTNTSQVLSVC